MIMDVIAIALCILLRTNIALGTSEHLSNVQAVERLDRVCIIYLANFRENVHIYAPSAWKYTPPTLLSRYVFEYLALVYT